MSAGIRRVRILVRTRTCSPKRVLFGRYVQAIASSCIRTVKTSRRELNDSKSAERDLQSPRAQDLADAKHHAVAIHERDVDSKLHEKRVDTAAGRENQGLTVGEARASKKTAIASGRVERRFDGPGDDASVARVA